MKESKPLCALTAVLTALALLTASIAAPILCRPFYYAHIGPLKFSTGVLKWSEEGKAHFTDVRGLFLLDLRVLGVSLGLLAAVLLYARFTGRRSARPLGRGPGFWAGAGLGAGFLLVGALAALDFDRAFVIFHALFFPGKDNWLFDPNTDQIINILPQDFFRNCAILILALLVIGCAALILWDFRRGRKRAA